MSDTTLIGIDCATEDAKIGLSLAVARVDQCVVQFAGACSRKRKAADVVTDWLSDSTRALIAFDAPLGWPQPLARALTAHRAGEPLIVPANQLFRRTTDRFLRDRLGKQSLDVGADRIARTAHSALELLAEVRQRSGLPIPMAWEPEYSDRVAAIEVYPAATLIAHGISDKRYKDKGRIPERRSMIASIEQRVQLPDDRSSMESNADALDAVVCALAGFDFLCGGVYAPGDLDLAKHEGWIWVRQME